MFDRQSSGPPASTSCGDQMWRENQLDLDRAAVLVIDVQEKLVPLISRHEQIIAAGKKLLTAVRLFHLPVLATEQYPKGLGRTVPAIQQGLETNAAKILEKPTFSAWAYLPVRQAILSMDRPQWILAGVETHVCIQQSALDLRSRDYEVFVCADAVGSRGRIDHEHALRRLANEGVYVTTVEAVLFELCQRCDTATFKAMIDVIKQTPPVDD